MSGIVNIGITVLREIIFNTRLKSQGSRGCVNE